MSEKTPLAVSSDKGKFLTVANQLITGIAQTDLAGRFVLVNDFFCEFLGYPREELLKKTLFEVTHPDDIARNLGLFQECITEGTPFTIEKRYLRKDGSPVWVRNAVSLLRDADGRAQYIIAVSSDISRERAAQATLEKSDERYRAFITQSSEAIWRFELDAPVAVTLSAAEQVEHFYRHAYLAECNDAVARMYGYQSCDEINGLRLTDFLPPEDAANAEYLRAFVESGYRLENAESHEVDRHGSPKFFLNNLVGVVENGFLLRAWGTQRDITEQKLIEQRIGESEERYRTVTETASDAIFQVDEASRILFVNHAAERLFGYKTDELIGQSLTVIMPENLRARHESGMRRYLETGLKKIPWESMEVPGLHKDGRVFPLEVSFGEYNETGRRFFIGIARDISARKQTEKAGAHLAAIVESSNDAIISKDLTSRILSWNKGAERIFGYPAKEVIGKSITILIPPELIDEEARILENIRQGRRIEHFETIRRRKDGTEIYVSITVSPIRDRTGKIVGASKIARDITESKEIENELRESQAMLALTMRSSRMGAWSRELKTDEVWWSDELEEIFGLPRGGFARTENGFYDLIHEDDRERVWAEVETAIAEKRDYIVEFRFLHADGSTRWMEGRGQAVYSDKGEPIRLYGIGIDITARKQAEGASERFRILSERARDIIFLLRPDGTILEANEAASRIYGYPRDELLKLKVHDLRAPSTLPQLDAQLAKANREGILFETLHRRKDGSDFPVEVNSTGAEIGGERLLLSVIRDITERKQAEEKLRQSETQLRVITDAMPALIAFVDADLRYKFVNKTYTEWFGHGPEEIIGKTVREVVGEAAFGAVESALQRVFAGEAFRFEQWMPYKDGGARFVSVNYIPNKTETGAVNGYYALVQDITERKKAEDALRESEENYRTLFETIDEGFCVIEVIFESDEKPVDYRFLQANPAFERLTGLANAIGRTARELVPDLENFWFETYGTVALTGESVRFENYSEPMNRWFDVYASRVGDAASRRVALVFNNITERKLSEEALQKSQTHLRMTTEAAQIGTWQWNIKSGQIIWSPIHKQLWGYEPSPAPVSYEDWARLIDTDDLKAAEAAIAKCLRGEEDYAVEYRIKPQGKNEICWIRSTGRADFNDAGDAVLMQGVSFDITGQKNAQEKLRESEERFRNMADHAPVMIWVTDATGFCSYLSQSWYDFTGQTPETGLGYGWLEATHPDDRRRAEEIFLTANEKRAPFRLEYRLRREDGEYRWAIDSAQPRVGTTGEFLGYIGSVIDISERKQAEEKLRESESTLRAFYASSPLMMGITEILPGNRDVLHIYDNPATCAFFGIAPDATANRTSSELGAKPEVTELWIKNYLESEGRGQPVSFEYEQQVEGVSRWLATTVSCLGTAGSGRSRFAYVSEDITEKKLAQEALIKAERRAAEEYLELLSRIVPLGQTLGTARDLISIYRSVGEFVRSSMPCSAFFVSFFDAAHSLRIAAYVWGEGAEVDADALPPMPITEAGGPNSQAILGKQVVVTNRGYMDKMRGRPHVVVQDNGIEPNSSIVVPMIVMNRVVGTLEVQAHEAEAYNREHTVALEMVANLAAVAIENVRLLQIEETARREAESANRAKDEFLSVVSHELRTPLNSMFGWTRMLKSGILDETKQKQAVEVIERNVRLQNSLIEDLLDVSRIISGKMRIETEETDFAAIVATAVEAARPVAEQKKISLIFETESASYPLEGDEVRLQQIVNNLINNAVKFTSEDGLVSLKLARRDRMVVLTVTDTGIGIAPEFLPKIFDRFLQADSTTKRTHSGLGLGLTIVRHLTELHGGQVSASSEGLGKGATFTVELPLAETFFSAAGADSAAVSNGGNSLLKGARILLVDDDREAMMPLQIILESQQAEVACASSAFEALEKLAAGKYDLIVSDIGMPEMDGYDMISLLRRSDASPNREIPAIALTAYASAQDKQRALQSGFQQHFAKPIDFDNFLASVRNIIRKASRK